MVDMDRNFETIYSSSKIIIRSAGDILKHYFDTPININFKGEFDMVTEADLASENFILHELKKLTPDIPVLSEEDTEKNGSGYEPSGGYLWVLDPLDGTTNFAHGFPHFCISMALFNGNTPQFALIFDPLRGELFSGTFNGGAFLNDKPCRISSNNHLTSSIVATGFPYKVRELKQNNLAEFCAFRMRCQGVRRIGAAALDLAYIASGRLDGFWERWLKPWDTAAGLLLIREAGGIVSRFDGSSYSIFDSDIVASNGLIHDQMIKVLTTNWPEIPSDFRVGIE